MDSNRKINGGRRNLARIVTAAVFVVLLGISFSPGLHAQAVIFNNGGACVSGSPGATCIGNFSNPPSLTTLSPVDTCNYDQVAFDLTNGKILAHPYRDASNAICASQAWTDITTASLTIVPGQSVPLNPFDGSTGLLEFGTFNLQVSNLAGASQPGLTLLFQQGVSCVVGPPVSCSSVTFPANANNTPIMIRATGNLTIAGNTTLWVAGFGGNSPSANNLLRGAGGLPGPGGYPGGAGGNGGLSATAGGAGFGPGGGAGGPVGTTGTTFPCPNNCVSAHYLTTGSSLLSGLPPIANDNPPSNDLLTMPRGGSGGGGAGGWSGSAGAGGGGGGGAITVTSNGTINVAGTITAQGGPTANGVYPVSVGTGGALRLVANTISGGGTITAVAGSNCCGSGATADNGIVRLEAFTLNFSGNLGGGVSAASAPGQIFTPVESAGEPAVLQFVSLTDSTNVDNAVQAPSPAAAAFPPPPGAYGTSTQNLVGRTGVVSNADVSIHPTNTVAGGAGSVNVVLGAGPSTFPTGKTVTLVVTPLDPAQGVAVTYTGTFTCPVVLPAPYNTLSCSASITNVTLPFGLSSMSAFAVVGINGTVLARMFPPVYKGEEIENVRLQTTGKDTEYVLISKTGKEFPFKPGR